MKRLSKFATLALIALVLSACAKLPMLAANEVGPEVVSKDKSESLYYSPQGPIKGSNQQEILTDFLYAGNGPQNDYAVARQFLTVPFSSRWNPNAETLIQTGSTETISNTGTKVRLLVHYDAKVNADGTYVATPGESRILEFRLLQENGEWRISSAPDLTALLHPNFVVLFQAIPVYFWDRAFAYLVPEIRWFPTKASLATRLTNAIIAGPTPWLAPAVQDLIPKGTKLSINSVTVNHGTANIDFNSSALKLPNWKRPYLHSQLLATLASVSGLTQVKISFERTVQDIPLGSSGMPDNPSNLPVVLNSDGLGHMAGGAIFQITGTKELVDAQKATDFAISDDETMLALYSKLGVTSNSLGILGSKSQVVDNRPKLIMPSIDPFNAIWTTSSLPGSSIRVTTTSGEAAELPNPLGNASIAQLVVSPEGSRVAMIRASKAGRVIELIPVIRDKSRRVSGFGQPVRISAIGQRVDSISWVNNTTINALATNVIGAQNVDEIMIGGESTNGRLTVGGQSVVTTVGGSQYYLDHLGSLFVSKTFGWEPQQAGVLAVHMAGQ